MNYVRIDNNRKIIGFAKGNVISSNFLQVDFDPENIIGHILKENYQEYSGKNQWKTNLVYLKELETEQNEKDLFEIKNRILINLAYESIETPQKIKDYINQEILSK